MKMVPAVDVILIVAAVAAASFAGLNYFHGASPGSTPSIHDRVLEMERDLVGRKLAPPEHVGANRATPEGWDSVNVVFAFSSTCPACEANAPRWLELARPLSGRVSLLAVGNEPRVTMDAWIERHGLPLPNAVVPQTPVSWGVGAVPTTMVVDRQGVVVAAIVGVLDAHEVELVQQVVDSLLSITNTLGDDSLSVCHPFAALP